MEHDWRDERHVDGEGREWQQACAKCGMRRRFHVTPKGYEMEVLSSVSPDCDTHLVKDVMRS